jgi:flagellar hook-associated protein 2
MTSQGLFSIGGIASGLDTQNIIAQLMRLERQPVVRMQQTQANLRKVDDAWGQVNTRLSALRKAVDDIAKADRFSGMVAVSSSNTDAVAVAKIGTPETGTMSFTVDRLATAHQVRSAAFAAADTPLAGSSISVAVGTGDAVTVTLDGVKTLTDVAKELNAGKGGFTATVVKVTDGEHRLVLSAGATGAANTIGVTSDVAELQTPEQLRAAQDALVSMGTMQISRASNTITDLVPGATITLKQTTSADVTVTAKRDVDAGVAAVKAYVGALNSAMTTIRDLSAYNAESKQSGPLQGNTDARQLLGKLRTAATAALGVDVGAFDHAFEVGITIDKTGAVSLDETKLRSALETDFDAVGRLFSRSGSATTSAATSVTGTPETTAGTYDVSVSRAADVARITGAAYTPPGATEPKTFRISSGGKTVTVTIDSSHTDAQSAALVIDQALKDAGISTVTASATAGGELRLEESRYGSAVSFTVEGLDANGDVDPAETVFDLAGSHAGIDVAGTINGAAATGAGRVLTASADGPAKGLSMRIDGLPADFTATYAHGLAGGMSNTLSQAEGTTGIVARARTGITSQIDLYQTRIDSFDQRLATREATLRRQFTAMESAMGAMNSQMSWLQSQLGSLTALNQQFR